MSDRDDWQFQWPDGTWVRWNPRTQSWEKKRAEDAPHPDEDEPDAAPSSGEPEQLPPRPAPEELEVETVPVTVDVADEQDDISGAEAEESPRAAPGPIPGVRRAGVTDVVPTEDGDPSPGSLWPTIVAGAITGIAIGVVVSFAIR